MEQGRVHVDLILRSEQTVTDRMWMANPSCPVWLGQEPLVIFKFKSKRYAPNHHLKIDFFLKKKKNC